MSHKPRILHFIVDLGRGGAESFLLQLLSELEDYENYIVTLNSKNEFGDAIKAERIICIDCGTFRKLPKAIWKFKKIISEIKPDIIHSQLTLSNMVARFATPKKVPLFVSIQNSIKYNIEFKNRFVKLLEILALTYNPGYLIFVSETVRNDYYEFLNIHRQIDSAILHNLVDIKRVVKKHSSHQKDTQLKLVTVGSLSYQKDMQFLVSAFLKANLQNSVLHIYGEGPQRKEIELQVKGCEGKVELKGLSNNIPALLHNYDLYVSSSRYEGFSLSVLEAMAAGLPLLLTDIPSFREQCGDFAMYYQCNSRLDFARQLSNIIERITTNNLQTDKAYDYVKNNFTLETQSKKLRQLYEKKLKCKLIATQKTM